MVEIETFPGTSFPDPQCAQMADSEPGMDKGRRPIHPLPCIIFEFRRMARSAFRQKTSIQYMKEGDPIKGWCKCGAEVPCKVRIYSNGTIHAQGRCQQCGHSGTFQQRNPTDMDTYRHKLMGIRSAVLGFRSNHDRDEAVAMLERLADELRRED